MYRNPVNTVQLQGLTLKTNEKGRGFFLGKEQLSHISCYFTVQ
uniref:Uncharacterized protein n=1 Tax=Anguilla anguilla TaxID=7936 RepID=A0A0E9Q837_ANGAN